MATINAVNTSLSGQSGSGAFAGTTNPLFSNPKANALYDINNLQVLALPAAAGAVNYWSMGNNSAGLTPTMSVAGSDPNIGMVFVTKGTGGFNFQSAALTQPIGIYSGTGLQHLTVFEVANTSANRIVTFPDATGTLLMTGVAINSVPSIAFSSTSGIIGTTTNNSAAAGSVGEFLASAVSGTVNFTTSNVAQNIQSISLTAGDWNVFASSYLQNGSTVTGGPSMSLSTTSATQASSGIGRFDCNLTNALTGLTYSVFNRFSLASTTTVYLVGQVGWTGTAGLYNAAQIVARRVR